MARKLHRVAIDPDEIFLDAQNIPGFNTQQFEGVMSPPIKRSVVFGFLIVAFLVAGIFLGRLFYLGVVRGDDFRARGDANSLLESVLFAERGVVYDRTNVELAWNKPERVYIDTSGFGHLLGYVAYPTETEILEDGFHPKELVGRDGIEKIFNDTLHGSHGVSLVEVDVSGATTSESVRSYPKDGDNISLSIDFRIQEKLFEYIESVARERGFSGGAGVIMDVQTGEVLALTNYPEYSSSVLSGGAEKEVIESYRTDPKNPFLNRAAAGLYTPGSIWKPFVAIAALNEGVVTKNKTIFTEGVLRLPNPYVPGAFTPFKDWKNHGPVNLVDAIAVSSNVYFYEVGGGFGDQPGLGISNIERYARAFGFGEKPGSWISGEERGFVPNPKWKEETFNDPWRLGDTYYTSIGQYAVSVTPLQMARAYAAIANGGTLLSPVIQKDAISEKRPVGVSIASEHYASVREGMREAVLRGTAQGLLFPGTSIAAKTGTAELDFGKQFVNSWVVGFFPYESPRYVFTVVMERGLATNQIGGVSVMRRLFEWMVAYAPEYFSPES